jgi:uncharacterized protein
MVKIEIIYPSLTEIERLILDLPDGSTVGDALLHSGFLVKHPEINALNVGIFSNLVTKDTVLKAGDRVEIYRSLVISPKEKRRQKAKKRQV